MGKRTGDAFLNYSYVSFTAEEEMLTISGED